MERRSGNGRRFTDGAIRIGAMLVRAFLPRDAQPAANDATFQTAPARARLNAKARANHTIFRALLRKLRTQAARAASPALTRVSGILEEVVWSAISITSPHVLFAGRESMC